MTLIRALELEMRHFWVIFNHNEVVQNEIFRGLISGRVEVRVESEEPSELWTSRVAHALDV